MKPFCSVDFSATTTKIFKFLKNQMKLKQIIKRLLGGVILIAILKLTTRDLSDFFNYDLHPAHVTSHLPYQAEWEMTPFHEKDPPQLYEIFNQTFSFLSEGGQTYVFASADEHYVLKLFKFHRFRPSPLVEMLPDTILFNSYRHKHRAKREKKLFVAFNGYKLAYEHHRLESGLIFMQLNSSHTPLFVTLIDKKGNRQVIDLVNISYILQEKGEIFSTALAQLLDQGKTDEARKRIRQLFDLYLSEYAKGLYDLDHGVMHNIGCIGDRLIHLDVGKMVLDERIKQPEFYQADLLKVAKKVSHWVHAKYPQHEKVLIEDIEKKLSLIFGKKLDFSIKL